MYFTYVLQSLTSNKLYVGQTNNLQDRIQRHNNSRNIYTKNKGPWKLIFSREFKSRTEAVKLEKRLKSFKNKDYLLKWVKEN